MKKRGSKRVWKSFGHFHERILAAKAVAKAQKKELKDIRKSKKAISHPLWQRLGRTTVRDSV